VLTVKDDQGNEVGKVQQHWDCLKAMCNKTYHKVYDKAGEEQYVMERDMCFNSNCGNMLCPCIFPVHHFGIFKPGNLEEEVGSLENIWPGCNFQGLCKPDADNYKLTFPTEATPDQKALLLGATMLVEFMHFEKGSEDSEVSV